MPREHETRENAQNKNEGTSNHFLLGMLVGGAVGAFAALLLAPKAGKDLRKTIKTSSVMEKTASLREGVVTKGSDILSTISDGMVQQSSELKNKTRKNFTPFSRDEEINYIPLGNSSLKNETNEKNVDDYDIRRKIEEAKKALDEEESKVKH